MKERIREIKVDKEVVACPKCGETENLDYKTGKVFYCRGKDSKNGCGIVTIELEEKVPIVEVQQYGFWLRFASRHFIPCKKCQEILDKLFKENWFYPNKKILLEFYPKEKFNSQFVMKCLGMNEVFRPCNRCQKKLRRIIDDCEFHIGNDTKPAVEFWRKWEIDVK